MRSSAAIISRSFIRLPPRRNLELTGEIEVLFAEAQLAQAQQRILRAFVGQRIEIRDGVAERAVGVDEPIDAGLQRRPSVGWRRAALGGARTIFRLHGAQFEALEKRRPGGIDGGRVLAPALVVLIEQVGVKTIRERNSHRENWAANLSTASPASK